MLHRLPAVHLREHLASVVNVTLKAGIITTGVVIVMDYSSAAGDLSYLSHATAVVNSMDVAPVMSLV